MHIGLIVDTSDYIINTIESLKHTILITMLIVSFVVLLFLGRWRATFVIVLTIPISLLSALIYLLATGNTMNIISMSALSIAIGMVVDNAIVVLRTSPPTSSAAAVRARRRCLPPTRLQSP